MWSQVRIASGLGSSVSEECTAYVFRRLSEDGGSMFLQYCNCTVPDGLVYVWKDTISIIFGLK